MECYEGATMIKTFRGLLSHGAQDTIVLHTNDGSMGYRIVKFQVIANVPGTTSHETVTKIYKIDQDPPSGSLVDGIIDFNDNTLLGAAFATALVAGFTYENVIVFDSEIFNQDIYVTNDDVSGNNTKMNYYIELEQVKLDLSESTVATLKDIRNEKRIPPG